MKTRIRETSFGTGRTKKCMYPLLHYRVFFWAHSKYSIDADTLSTWRVFSAPPTTSLSATTLSAKTPRSLIFLRSTFPGVLLARVLIQMTLLTQW